MSASEAISVLRRKAAVGRQEYQSRAMTAARSVRLSLPKAGDELFDMALAVIALTQNSVPQKKVAEIAGESSLLMLLDGPDGRSGAAIADGAFAGALVQQQTMGQVFKELDPDNNRPPTRTEAMLFAPLIDGLLVKSAEMAEVDEDIRMLSDLRFGDWVENPRLLDIALEDSEYEHFSLTTDIAGGVRQGRLDLLLPLPQEPAPVEGPRDLTAPLAKAALSLPAELNVAICRVQMSLSDVTALRQGDAIPIASESLGNAEILGITGAPLGRGKLGQVGGKRAVRPVLPEPVRERPQRRASDPAATEGGFENADAPIDISPMDTPPAEMPLALPEPAEPASDLIDMPLADLPGEGGGMDLPDLPELDDAGLPDLPALDDEAPTLLDLPASSEIGGDLAGLPDLPDLDDLPDLADPVT